MVKKIIVASMYAIVVLLSCFYCVKVVGKHKNTIHVDMSKHIVMFESTKVEGLYDKSTNISTVSSLSNNNKNDTDGSDTVKNKKMEWKEQMELEKKEREYTKNHSFHDDEFTHKAQSKRW